jgi:uncharacterized SAM-binding protein YcdF (DUF218 family)
MRLRYLLLQVAGIATASLFANYHSIPTSNTQLTHFDTIIVLGVPTNPDGSVSPEEKSRVEEGVREFKAGIAPHIIMTGGPAHNTFVEAHAMKRYAITLGVPDDAIIEEAQAKDTIQNIYFSNEIMQSYDWHSAEVVSSPSHLPRTALILQHYTFAWRTHPAKWPPEFNQAKIDALFLGEANSCWTITHEGFKPNKWLPGS